MKKTVPKTDPMPPDDMRPEYDFDYGKARPNRFARRKHLFTRSAIEKIVKASLDQLRQEDFDLLENDVSERAITHKLAEYLQSYFFELKVDCEYNRNFELGEFARKELFIFKQEKIKANLEDDDLLAISAYPDIIVHQRKTNDENLLVIEVKKRNSQIDHMHDYQKLKAFTERSARNNYHYQYGVFILLGTREKASREPELKWFVEGKEVSGENEPNVDDGLEAMA